MTGEERHCIIDPEHECYGLKEARKVRQELNDHILKDMESRSQLFSKINELAGELRVRDVQYNNIIEKLDGLTKTVGSLESKPAKRWDDMVNKVISLVIGAVVGYFLVRLGMG